MTLERLHLQIIGRVQRVGFRDFAESVADRFSLSGFTENLADRSVIVVYEGERPPLEAALAVLRAGPRHAVIRSVTPSWSTGTGEFPVFSIRYGDTPTELLLTTQVGITYLRSLDEGQEQISKKLGSIGSDVRVLKKTVGERFDRVDRRLGSLPATVERRVRIAFEDALSKYMGSPSSP